MCKIRVIIRDKKDGVLYDDFIELTTNLHAVGVRRM